MAPDDNLQRVAAPEDREEFERRLLALVRDYLDAADEIWPGGYQIGDFMVLYEVFARVDEKEALDPWSGGVRVGFDAPVLDFSSTHRSMWLDEAWLAEALARIRATRQAAEDYEAGSGEPEDDTEEALTQRQHASALGTFRNSMSSSSLWRRPIA